MSERITRPTCHRCGGTAAVGWAPTAGNDDRAHSEEAIDSHKPARLAKA
ncbi:hypothetical protein [Blastococcus saxobsidens]|nr:hypothetical protein [Blastococcus saxobsidens]